MCATKNPTMKHVEIVKISILNSGELEVRPIENWKNLFQFIYRAATGVHWNEKTQSFFTPKPKQFSYSEWYENIISSVSSEIGVKLETTHRTTYKNIPKTLKEKLENQII